MNPSSLSVVLSTDIYLLDCRSRQASSLAMRDSASFSCFKSKYYFSALRMSLFIIEAPPSLSFVTQIRYYFCTYSFYAVLQAQGQCFLRRNGRFPCNLFYLRLSSGGVCAAMCISYEFGMTYEAMDWEMAWPLLLNIRFSFWMCSLCLDASQGDTASYSSSSMNSMEGLACCRPPSVDQIELSTISYSEECVIQYS